MTEISDSLRLLFETTLRDNGGDYTVTIPSELVENGSLTPGDTYRVALLASASTEATREGGTTTEPTEAATATEAASEPDRSSSSGSDRRHQRPPVEEGEVRSVTIDTLGDKGDGIAKVERGFIVIVSDTQPGDQVDVEITDVKDTVAFAEPVSEPTVR